MAVLRLESFWSGVDEAAARTGLELLNSDAEGHRLLGLGQSAERAADTIQTDDESSESGSLAASKPESRRGSGSACVPGFGPSGQIDLAPTRDLGGLTLWHELGTAPAVPGAWAHELAVGQRHLRLGRMSIRNGLLGQLWEIQLSDEAEVLAGVLGAVAEDAASGKRLLRRLILSVHEEVGDGYEPPQGVGVSARQGDAEAKTTEPQASESDVELGRWLEGLADERWQLVETEMGWRLVRKPGVPNSIPPACSIERDDGLVRVATAIALVGGSATETAGALALHLLESNGRHRLRYRPQGARGLDSVAIEKCLPAATIDRNLVTGAVAEVTTGYDLSRHEIGALTDRRVARLYAACAAETGRRAEAA